MLEKLRKDYNRYSRQVKKHTILELAGIMFRFLIDAGFRAVVLYRAGNWFYRHKLRIVSKIIECFMHHLCHCWIGSGAIIDEGFLVAHVSGVIIGNTTIIGKNCDVRQNVTLGANFNKKDAQGRQYPVVGDNVSICAGAVVIGPVKIGNNSIIGANSVVNRDIPENVIAAGNPAKVIRERWPESSGRIL